METKYCTRCQKTKDITSFGKHKGGHHYRCKSCMKEVWVENRVKQGLNPEAYKKRNNRKNYGESAPSFYSLLLGEQGGKCSLCLQPETATRNGRIKELVLDHCHETGSLRGVLCHLCNTGIHRFKDSVDLIEKASEYLRYWAAVSRIPMDPDNKRHTTDYLIKKQFKYREEQRKKQSGVCAVCGEDEKKTYRGFAPDLCLDHDHKDMTLRGLLCYDCNRGLGCFRDDLQILENVKNYLRLPNR